LDAGVVALSSAGDGVENGLEAVNRTRDLRRNG
jgi:hypothetical protein